jgi:hypothetical protein
MRPTAASPSAAITCRDLSSRPAWRTVVSLRSWRDAKLSIYPRIDAVAACEDAGPDWHDLIAPLRRRRQLIAELERLSGKKVAFEEAA